MPRLTAYLSMVTASQSMKLIYRAMHALKAKRIGPHNHDFPDPVSEPVYLLIHLIKGISHPSDHNVLSPSGLALAVPQTALGCIFSRESVGELHPLS